MVEKGRTEVDDGRTELPTDGDEVDEKAKTFDMQTKDDEDKVLTDTTAIDARTADVLSEKKTLETKIA